jgi:hypothetical protein
MTAGLRRSRRTLHPSVQLKIDGLRQAPNRLRVSRGEPANYLQSITDYTDQYQFVVVQLENGEHQAFIEEMTT